MCTGLIAWVGDKERSSLWSFHPWCELVSHRTTGMSGESDGLWTNASVPDKRASGLLQEVDLMAGPNAPLMKAFIFCGRQVITMALRQKSLHAQLQEATFLFAALDCSSKSRAWNTFSDGRPTSIEVHDTPRRASDLMSGHQKAQVGSGRDPGLGSRRRVDPREPSQLPAL